ncbi:S41 family peptidase [Gorillibacterium sp. sgz5001074]|uniref:S41 family peptidase n=1 Tax=Gorillibacterium sp. sgz5001074 TaxID=3446695 RepID=UPI003F661440
MSIRSRSIIPAILVTALVSSGLTLVWAREQDKDWVKLKSVYSMLNKEYVQTVDTTKLMDGAVDGMLKALDDPYTVYMSQEESKGFEESITSSFVGIGAEITELDGHIVIVAPIKNSPAEKAGLKPNDRIVSVGATSLEGMKVSEAVKQVRGEKGTKAELTIERPGESEPLHVTVVRDTIPIETVYGEMKEGQIGYLQITKVSESTAQEFAKQLKTLKDQGMKGLVLDLRQNPGGLLGVSFEIAEMLVPAGKTILQVENRSGKKEIYTSNGSGANPSVAGLPMAALIDEGTASAGEILAGALQESGGAKLVGQKTFGKGTAQAVVELDDGSTVKYTNAKWLTPGGTWIHKTGIKPDVEVKLPEYAGLPLVDPEKEWRKDSFSTDVKSIQMMLEALGYPAGRTDGYFDGKTEAAVLAFQQAQGLEANGVVSGKTTRRMIELLRELIRKSDPQLEAALKVAAGR